MRVRVGVVLGVRVGVGVVLGVRVGVGVGLGVDNIAPVCGGVTTPE